MDHARIIHEQHRPGLLHGEAHTGGPPGVEHPRLAAAHATAVYQDDRYEIHTVPMRTLRSRTADACGGVNAKLMRLDEPPGHGMQLCEQRAHGSEQLSPGE